VVLVRTDVSEELLLVTVDVLPSLLILVTLMLEAIRSSETSALTRVTAVRPRGRHSSQSPPGNLKYYTCSSGHFNLPVLIYQMERDKTLSVSSSSVQFITVPLQLSRLGPRWAEIIELTPKTGLNVNRER
jgi:hypothetical protein